MCYIGITKACYLLSYASLLKYQIGCRQQHTPSNHHCCCLHTNTKLLNPRLTHTQTTSCSVLLLAACWTAQILDSVPVGPNSLSLTLGDECLGGCEATLVLSLPRPAAGAATDKAKAAITPITDLKLPVSKLFDPLMPATASASVSLDVLEDNRLNVSVSITPAAAGDAGGSALPSSMFKSSAVGPDGRVLPVMRPGASADIQVKVRLRFSVAQLLCLSAR